MAEARHARRRSGRPAAQPPLAAIEADQTLDRVFATLTGRTIAFVIANNGKPIGALKRSDLLEYLAHQRGNSSR